MSSPQSSISLPPRHDTFLKIFTKHQLHPNPKPAYLKPGSISVAHQTGVITGGNAGIGLESGRLLLSLGLSQLILAARSPSKGQEAAAALQKQYPKAKIDVWQLDLNSYDSIREFARKCAALPRLDIAILSAGIMNVGYKTSPVTGREEMLQVNYLSTALLAILLLPTLKREKPSGANTPGRLTLVASGAALIAEFSEGNGTPLHPPFDKQGERWNMSAAKKRYDLSKSMVLMLGYTLSKMIKPDETVINIVDPSFTPGTSFFHNLPLLIKIFAYPLAMLLGTSTNSAGWRYVDAAVARGKESHGSFLSDWEINPYGKQFMDRLWNETVNELDFPEVREAMESIREK
ncbi:hypothetical protein BGW36DRAFT_448508 [Talaromyces proteolyticus]|uniref:Short-chain dehydrogenase/reductase family protein n=1 Tax=Talaromyces proteolyticus TaxID=1131652 RepID=A0AAD4Q1G9_9EURO|nr:uncharacterized protein BGW36DRAFT_448508 [Talaromyces proteolyticus]KAH8698533.1 hypothetical protein BGW36DRAFT_448508 [Talaromyces proteolyticus]